MRCPDLARLTMLAMVAAGAAGCLMFPNPLIHRVSIEFECEPARINVVARRDISYGLYDVEACGYRARYTCVPGYRYGPHRCIHEADPPKWDPDPALAANLPDGDSASPGEARTEGTWRRVCGPLDDRCAFWQDGAWRWRPARVVSCNGGYGAVCD